MEPMVSGDCGAVLHNPQIAAIIEGAGAKNIWRTYSSVSNLESTQYSSNHNCNDK